MPNSWVIKLYGKNKTPACFISLSIRGVSKPRQLKVVMNMKIKWRCHRGFLRVWKTIKPYIEQIDFSKAKKIVVVGYSHGAAIATLCHEYIWFNYLNDVF